jgi:hypothetical protein
MHESAKLKLRALALRAEGGDDAAFRSAVLFHEAARTERRGLTALREVSPTTQLRSLVEQCSCLVDGRNPHYVIDQSWGDVLEQRQRVDGSTGEALTKRLLPKVTALIAEFQRTQHKAKELFQSRIAETREQARLQLQQAQQVVRTFPGDVLVWVRGAALYNTVEEPEQAWQWIRRARELDPDLTLARMAEIGLSVAALPDAESAVFLDAVFSQLDRGPASPDECMGFCSAALVLAKREVERKKHLQRCASIAVLGLSQASSLPLQHSYFRAVKLVADAWLAKQPMSVDLLYRSGLGRWIEPSRMHGKTDPVDILVWTGSLHRPEWLALSA